MGIFSTALAADKGSALKQRYMQIGNNTYAAVGQIAQLATDYSQFRTDLAADSGTDAEDVTLADSGFALTVTDAAAAFASLTTSQKAWLDQFFAGLGYVPASAE